MTCARILPPLPALLLAAVLAGGAAARAATTNPPAPKAPAHPAAAKGQTNVPPVETPIPVSVFVIPPTRSEGVDPFYPQSSRLASTTVTTATNRPPERAELVIKGFSGTPTRPFVIINDRTFEVKDQFEVLTPQGRVRVRCLEIRPNESAVVEVNGTRRELFFPRGK